MRTMLLAAALIPAATLVIDAQRTAAVRVSNSYLQTACVDGTASTLRKWDLPQRETTMTFTMRNLPRPGRAAAEAGFAAISFTPEPGHAYEIEVRSDPGMYSTRVWPKGEWRPVVRDRTTNQIISGEPSWLAEARCR